jgi:hypothetical protein
MKLCLNFYDHIDTAYYKHITGVAVLVPGLNKAKVESEITIVVFLALTEVWPIFWFNFPCCI